MEIVKSKGVGKIIGGLVSILGIILAIIGAFLENEKAVITLGIIGSLMIVIGLLVLALKSEKNTGLKALGAFVVGGLLITWILPYGYYSGADYYNYEMARIGLMDFGTALYYAVYFAIDKIVYLVAVGGMYGVLSITKGYKNLVKKVADKFGKHPIIFSVVISFIITAFVTMTSQSFIALAFIPFFVSVLCAMKVDKLSAFAITFGSTLIGVLGATYGTENLVMFNSYMGTEVSLGVLYRFIILAISFILYTFFIVMRLRKTLGDKKIEAAEDPFEVTVAEESRSSVIPTIVMLVLLFIVSIMGFVKWNNWQDADAITDGTVWQSELHNYVTTELTIGEEEFAIFGQLFGENALEFGAFELVTGVSLLVIATILLAVLYGVKLEDFMNAFLAGIKKMFKPIVMVFGVYLVFVICYMSPFVPTIANWLFEMTSSFNPYITSLVGLISAAFHTDLGYTAYLIGTYITTAFSTDLAIAHTIMISMYGLVQVFLPTSVLLMVGLSMMKLEYKNWFKYIWMFVVGIIVILLVLFTVVTYI